MRDPSPARGLKRRRVGCGSVNRIGASTVIDAPASAVFAFLAEAPNHQLLSGARIRLLELSQNADRTMQGTMLVRGPLLLRRRAATRMTSIRQPLLLAGWAQVGASTSAMISWELEPQLADRTNVTLVADVLSIAVWDRVMLCLGGRRWMRAAFAETVGLLASAIAPDRQPVHEWSGLLSVGSPCPIGEFD